jgi:hypothetical protein
MVSLGIILKIYPLKSLFFIVEESAGAADTRQQQVRLSGILIRSHSACNSRSSQSRKGRGKVMAFWQRQEARQQG